MEYLHLSRIVELFPNTAVSRFATYKIRKNLIEEGLAFDEEIVGSLLICRKCSNQLLPGINCDVTIEKSRRTYKNCAAYACHLCKVKTRFAGIKKGFSKYDLRKEKKNFKEPEKIEEKVNYDTPVIRTLNKIEKKKSLLDSFFESAEKTNLYKIFH